MNEQELRFYTFTNFMLSPIQQGIQPWHASMELVNKYMVEQGWVNGMAEQVTDWIANHKTVVCLNGGNAAGVRDIKAFLDLGMQSGQNTFPYAGFYEDEQSLDGALTSVATILPARIFETAALIRARTLPPYISYTHDKLLGEHRFANSFINNDGNSEVTLETFSEWEYELMALLNQHGLAR